MKWFQSPLPRKYRSPDFSLPECPPRARHCPARNSIPGEDFVKVMVSPVALLNRNRLVLLIWPDFEQEQLSEQINKHLDVGETPA